MLNYQRVCLAPWKITLIIINQVSTINSSDSSDIDKISLKLPIDNIPHCFDIPLVLMNKSIPNWRYAVGCVFAARRKTTGEIMAVKAEKPLAVKRQKMGIEHWVKKKNEMIMSSKCE